MDEQAALVEHANDAVDRDADYRWRGSTVRAEWEVTSVASKSSVVRSGAAPLVPRLFLRAAVRPCCGRGLRRGMAVAVR